MNEKPGGKLPSFLAPVGDMFTKARDWILDRTGLEEFMAETEKKTVPRHALNPAYCLGGITLVAFIVLAFTGIFLANYYEPSDGGAQRSIQVISTEIPFGFYARSVHAWSANVMVIAILLHTLRVFITGSYKRPRELTWVGGVLLMVFTFLFVLTGYILPMDDRAEFAAEFPAKYFLLLDHITSVTSPRYYREYCLPIYELYSKQLEGTGKIIGVHMDGRFGHLKREITESPINVIDSFSVPPIGDVSLSEAKELWPDKMMFMNPAAHMAWAEPEELRKFYESLAAEWGNKKGLLLEYMEHLPMETVGAHMSAAMEAFGY